MNNTSNLVEALAYRLSALYSGRGADVEVVTVQTGIGEVVAIPDDADLYPHLLGRTVSGRWDVMSRANTRDLFAAVSMGDANTVTVRDNGDVA